MELDLSSVIAVAEDLMLDECIITRLPRPEETLPGTWNDTTGTYDPSRAPATVLYEGKCMVYSRRVDAQTVIEGGESLSSSQFYVSLPITSTYDLDIQPEDVVEVVDIGPSSPDETMIGMTFSVETADHGTYMATREISMVIRKPQLP